MKLASWTLFNFYRARFVLLSLVMITCCSSFALANKHKDKDSDKSDKSDKKVDIDNFGQIDDYLFRGGQPGKRDFSYLASRGIKTVINLRDDEEGYEKDAVLAAGMKYVHIPMSDKSLPSGDPASEFLKTVNDRGNGPFYVHCAGGRHRTGAMVAIYRFKVYNWDFNKAYAEMKDYDFYTRWGHKPIKEYVSNYFRDNQTIPSNQNTAVLLTSKPAVETETKPATQFELPSLGFGFELKLQ